MKGCHPHLIGSRFLFGLFGLLVRAASRLLRLAIGRAARRFFGPTIGRARGRLLFAVGCAGGFPLPAGGRAGRRFLLSGGPGWGPSR